jgi:phosphonate transport system substrate-binding protein
MNYGSSHGVTRWRKIISILLAGIVLFSAAACELPLLSALAPATPSPTATPDLALTPFPTATIAPVGTDANPIRLALIAKSDVSQDRLQAGIAIASQLTQATGLTVHAQTYPDYPSLVDALQQGQIHIAFLPPLTYLYARERDLVQIALLANHFGVYLYGTQLIANQASGFTSYFDSTAGKNTVEPGEALQQFSGKRPCWTDPGSASGYIYPIGLLKANNIEIADPAIVQSHAGVIRALYVQGICDFGATYAGMGDPLTSNSVSDLPGVQNQIVILWRSDPVIPNLNVSFSTSLPVDIQDRLSGAFMSYAQTDEGRSTLSLANDYDIKDMQQYDDSAYDALRNAVNQSGTALINMIGN